VQRQANDAEAGVGIMLGNLGGDVALGALTLNNYPNVQDTIDTRSLEQLRMLNTYSEASPTGTGVSAFFLYGAKALARLQALAEGKRCAGVELHLSNHCIAFTGRCRSDTPRAFRFVRLDILERLISRADPSIQEDCRADNDNTPADPVTGNATAEPQSAGRDSAAGGNNPPDLVRIAALRAELWDAGYRPLAVYSHDHVDRARAGKAPLGAQWRERALRDPPEAAARPAVAHAANTGVLCDGLRAVDIDVDDRNIAGQLRALAQDMLGDTIIRTRENSGRCLLPYRAAEGSPRKKTLPGQHGKIEILGEGQQFVAHGVHPSGAQLRWFPVGPEKMSIENLPAVTEEQIHEFLRAAAPLIEADPHEDQKKSNGQAGPHVSPGDGVPFSDIVDVMAALDVIPNNGPRDWDFWSNLGMAVWLATGGSELGFAALHAWSAQHPDFDEAELLARWDHYPASPPDRTGAGKLYAMAAKALPGWRRPSETRQALAGGGRTDPPLECVALEPVGKENIPQRAWTYGKFLLFGSASVIGAIDGGGKGVIAVGIVLSMITGKPLLGEDVWRTGPVAIVSYEDDEEEWHRRIAAACDYHQVDYATAIANITFIKNPNGRVSFAKRTLPGGTLFSDGDAVITILQDIGAVLLIVDPFNHAHDLDDGNNNAMIAKVAGEMTRIAQASRAAVLVLHHLRKGATGEPDDLMGATALRATFRSARILQRMTSEAAGKMNISDPWRFIRIASSKENYAPPPDQETWFKFETVQLGNGAGLYTGGDEVAVARLWQPRPLFDGMARAELVAVFQELRQSLYSPNKQARNTPWAGKVLIDIGRRSEIEAGRIIEAWLDNGVLIKQKYYHTGSRHEVEKVVLNEVEVAKILA
jgi:RecA-family ATPase